MNRRRGAVLPPGDTRVIDLTVDELNDVVRHATRIAIGAELPEAMAEAERQLEADGGGLRVGRKRYVFGIDGIARTFGVSRSTARRIKRSGVIEEATTFINQVGDIRLDANVEYRTRLFWKFELAAYVDAGNIWTIRRYDYQPRGDFSLSRFYREIALSYGLGLRLDFDYFLIRFDTGLKAYDPQQRGMRRWVVTRPNLTDHFAWHFAVGYPF